MTVGGFAPALPTSAVFGGPFAVTDSCRSSADAVGMGIEESAKGTTLDRFTLSSASNGTTIAVAVAELAVAGATPPFVSVVFGGLAAATDPSLAWPLGAVEGVCWTGGGDAGGEDDVGTPSVPIPASNSLHLASGTCDSGYSPMRSNNSESPCISR